MVYQCKHFLIEELVPRETFKKHGDKCWLLFDNRLLYALDCLRDQFGQIVINTWNTGGVYQYRGWRPADVGFGASLSQHFFGRAADMNFVKNSDFPTAESVRTWLKANYKTVLEPKGCVIKRVENITSWLHIDVGNTVSDEIVFFNP
jgi:hypothetical protein